MTQRFYLSLFIILILSLSACGGVTKHSPSSESADAAQAAELAGDYYAAAEQYQVLAEKTIGRLQSHYYLRAALAFWLAKDSSRSNESLNKVLRKLLDENQKFDAAILEATLALNDDNAEHALVALSSFDNQHLNDTKNRRLLALRIQAYAITQNWLKKINNHLLLAQLLSNSERQQNQQELWQSLLSMTPQSLDLFNPGIPPTVESGWFELAYIVQSYQENIDAFIVALDNWKRDYPNHPADPALYSDILKTRTKLPKELKHIAILLPETGPYKSAADAIKQGIIASHFQANSNAELHFYPITTEPNNVLQQYQQAVDNDASIVIGPLAKKSVEILIESEKLNVPVLALNRLSTDAKLDNLFQFGLAPEDDAVAIANYASGQGYKRTVVLSPNNNWGERVSKAFNDQWLENDGILLNQGLYDSNQNDFSNVIKPILGLKASTQRYNSLKQTLGLSLEFEPRRRQDIDFIFIAAKPLKARQLVPQLKFHRSGTMPIIATSQAFSGRKNSQQDIDLNNLLITDIPWIFADDSFNDPVYNALKQQQAEHFNKLIRLYALGTDAYRLTSELNRLSRSADFIFAGATGNLSINKSKHIHRETRWGIFTQSSLSPVSVTKKNE